MKQIIQSIKTGETILEDIPAPQVGKGQVLLIDANQKGKIDASYSVWSLLAINSWINQFQNHT